MSYFSHKSFNGAIYANDTTVCFAAKSDSYKHLLGIA